MKRPPISVLLATIAICLIPSGVLLRGQEPLVQVDDAYVIPADSGVGWSIGTGLIRYSIGQLGQTMVARGLQDALTDNDWLRSNAPDNFITVNGQRVNIGAAATTFLGADASEYQGGVRLNLRYRLASVPMQIIRSYATYPGSGVIETWTTFRTEGTRAATLSDLTNFSFTVQNGTLRWLTGIATPADQGGAFTLASGDLDDAQTFELSASRRASELCLPWISIQAPTDDGTPGDQFFGSILWSGSWRIRAQRLGDTIAIQLGLPTFNTTLGVGASLDTPHAVFGITNALVPEVSMSLRRFIDVGLRQGRRYGSYITYNSWFAYGTFIDEGSLLAEMDQAAAMGVEQFVVDAGWWFHINPEDSGDFTTNLGNWQVDPERFPNGLGVLSDHAHELGMRFGAWVEPERVALATVGVAEGAKERFLATSGGRYHPEMPNSEATAAQVCLADPEARQWVVNNLIKFVDEARLDYLKWDNNDWVNCDRANHGHGPQDGNFAHMRGLQSVLQELRETFPALDIENCASGGNRISLDMLAYSDSTWMDDQSAPSARVRHNLQGLSSLFPPAYLLSFTMAGDGEPVIDDPTLDLPLLMRSRMPGMMGMSWFWSELGEGNSAAVAKQLALYKQIRPIVEEGSAILLSPQVIFFDDQPWSGWDVTEHIVPRTGDALIFAFDTADGPESTLVRPKALRPNAMYDVESADYGPLGSVRGSELMSRGIEIQSSGISKSHILIFRAGPDTLDIR